MAGFKWEDPDNFADARKLFLKEGLQVISDMCKIAKNGIDAVDDGGLVNHSDRKYVFEAMMPMLHAAKDTVQLEHLSTMTREERFDAICKAVLMGDISPDDAKNVIEVMKMMDDTGVEDDMSNKLIINVMNTPDTTIAGQVIDAMPEMAKVIK